MVFNTFLVLFGCLVIMAAVIWERRHYAKIAASRKTYGKIKKKEVHVFYTAPDEEKK